MKGVNFMQQHSTIWPANASVTLSAPLHPRPVASSSDYQVRSLILRVIPEPPEAQKSIDAFDLRSSHPLCGSLRSSQVTETPE